MRISQAFSGSFAILSELLCTAYRRCKQEGIVTKERHDELVKALDDDPIVDRDSGVSKLVPPVCRRDRHDSTMVPLTHSSPMFCRPWMRRPPNSVLRSTKRRYKRRCGNGN